MIATNGGIAKRLKTMIMNLDFRNSCPETRTNVRVPDRAVFTRSPRDD
jgi:hypothetical protein